MKDTSENLYKTAIEQLASESGLPALFLRRATMLFEEGKFDEALLEVKGGLKYFPGHPPAYYLLIRIFLELKKPNLAEITLNSAAKFFATNELTNYYRELISEVVTEIENRNSKDSGAISKFSIPESEEEPEPGPLPDETEINDPELEESTPPEETSPWIDLEPEEEDTIDGSYHNIEHDNVAESTEQLPEEIKAKPVDIAPHGDEIITAGMAIIYARQGNTPKAIEIFSKLIEKEPEKKESYEKIISLLRSKSQQT
ncbi:MAG: tetratricopeptide repeat protein [Ignavibacteriales bacterium]|nr:tetratricopeptide repeat protein [Ignavibacteriales bacterium]